MICMCTLEDLETYWTDMHGHPPAYGYPPSPFPPGESDVVPGDEGGPPTLPVRSHSLVGDFMSTYILRPPRSMVTADEKRKHCGRRFSASAPSTQCTLAWTALGDSP